MIIILLNRLKIYHRYQISTPDFCFSFFLLPRFFGVREVFTNFFRVVDVGKNGGSFSNAEDEGSIRVLGSLKQRENERLNP